MGGPRLGAVRSHRGVARDRPLFGYSIGVVINTGTTIVTLMVFRSSAQNKESRVMQPAERAGGDGGASNRLIEEPVGARLETRTHYASWRSSRPRVSLLRSHSIRSRAPPRRREGQGTASPRRRASAGGSDGGRPRLAATLFSALAAPPSSGHASKTSRSSTSSGVSIS
jgi:hypothetical protein